MAVRQTSGAGTELVPALAMSGIVAGYESSVILRDVDLTVSRGSVVAVLGPNGAGKTTLLRVASGLLRPQQGTVKVGGVEVTGRSPHQLVSQGVCHIPEGRGIFASLTVEENLAVFSPKGSLSDAVEDALSIFPALGIHLRQSAGTLSGGEQQMLALARACIQRPRVILLDEVSIGLAPTMVDRIYESIAQLASEDISLVIVEQYVSKALAIADHVYLLSKGEVQSYGQSSDFDRDELFARYSGTRA